MIKWYLAFAVFLAAHSTDLSGQSSTFDKVTKSLETDDCETAITQLEKILQTVKPGDLQKKLNTFLAIGTHCKGKEFRKQTSAYLDSVIQHPKSFEYPKIVRAAYFQKELQTFDVDSSLKLFKSWGQFEKRIGNDSTLAGCYLKLASVYWMKQDFGQSKTYYEKGFDLAKSIADQRLAYIGLAITIEDNPPLSDSLFLKAIDLSYQLKDSSITTSTLNQYGKFLKNQGRFNDAIKYLVEGLNILPDLKRNNLLRLRVNNDISMLFMQLRDYKRAEEYIQEAISISEANKYKSRNGTVAAYYGAIAFETNRFDLAKEELSKSFEYFTKRKAPNTTIGSLALLGQIALIEDDKKMADHYHFKGLQLMKEANGQANKNRFYIFSGRRYLKMGDLKKAKKAYQNLQNWAIETNRPGSEILALQQLAKISQKANNFKESLSYYKEFKALEDSIFRSNQNQKIFDIESKYNRAEQDKAIALLDTENIKKQYRLSQQNIIIMIGGIALVLISLLSFFLFRLFKKVQSQKVKISKALKEKDTLLREIHHRVKNNLQLVSSLLSLQSRHISDPNALEALNSGKSRVKSMALIHQDLYNRENLTGVSVKDYLEKLCAELVSTYQINTDKVSLHTNIPDLQLDVDTLVPLGLIINELLTNALKYAFPNDRKGRIDVSLKEVEGQLQLMVKDNGIGIDTEQKSTTSFGYKLIDTLLHQLQGSIKQESDNGTHVFLTFNHYKIAA